MEPAAHPVTRSGAEIEQLVARQQLLRPGRPVVVMLSGGRDSTCLLDLCVRLAGRDATTALHFNHGLRATAYEDEEACRLLCERLGVSLAVRRAQQPPRGNVQAWARDQRYASAREMAARRDADAATGHTATDRVEGLLYRLAASPGRRALVGMRPRAGRLVRPLLSIHRHETAAYCRERGLPFVEDPTNESPGFARNRIRHGLLTALREVHPAAEANVLSTLGILGDEAEVLDDLVARVLEDAGQPPQVERLQALAPALRRLAVQALADRAAGGMAPSIAGRVEEILALGGRGGTAVLHLPGGLRAEASYGRLRFALEGPDGQRQTDPPADGWLPIPGRLAFAGGEISSRRGCFPVADGTLDADALADRLHVRSWQAGDRMRPLGLRGSKTLQDIFTDAKVPSGERTRLPVVVSGGEIAWIPGVATGEAFRVRDSSAETVRLVWSPRQ